MDWNSFLGNEAVKTRLRRAMSEGRFPHAVAVYGEEGCGKRTFASLIAKALVCRNRDRAPCCECPSCLRADAGSHPDIRVIQGSGAGGAITVDALRMMISDAYRVPEEADVSVYILLMGAHTGDIAQNKLLKIIEEPPDKAVFILVCETAEQLLPTIRSRVQSFTLRPPGVEEAAAWAVDKLELDRDAALSLAKLCGGNLSRMEKEAQGGEEARAMTLAAEIAGAMLESTGHHLMAAAAPMQKDREFFRDVLVRLEGIFRDACVLRAGGTALYGGAPDAAEKLSARPKKRLMTLPGLAAEFRRKLDMNANQPLLLTCLCVRLREAAGR